MPFTIPPPAPLPGEAMPTPGLAFTAIEFQMLRSLMRLDAAVEEQRQTLRRPVILRIGRGVAGHFRLRVSEWFTTALLLQFGLILYAPPNVFETSPNFAVMARWAAEETWGMLCLAVGGVHLLALTVNGTFPAFRLSPHIRFAASFLACFMWFQITLAIFMSGVGGTGLGTYRLVLALEIYNVIRAGLDVGAVIGRGSVNGR